MMLNRKKKKKTLESHRTTKKLDMSDMRGDKRGTERKIVLDNLKKNPNICLNTVYSLSAIVKKWFFSFVLPRTLLFRSKHYFRFVKNN